MGPQLEDGYLKVSNELAEAFARSPLFSYRDRIIWLVIRYTYGFNRSEATMSFTFIANGTGIRRRHVISNVKSLVLSKALVRRGSVTKLNKNYSEWLVPRMAPGAQDGTSLVPRMAPKKDNLKDITTTVVVKPPPTKKEKRDQNEPMTTEQFRDYCLKSPQEHIKIIGRWADVSQATFTTYAQWQDFIGRHLKAARKLVNYTVDQRNTALEKAQRLGQERGFDPTLETVFKFIK